MENSFFEFDFSKINEAINHINGNYSNSTLFRKIITFPLFLICYILLALCMTVYIFYISCKVIFDFISGWSTSTIAYILGIAFIWLWLFVLLTLLIIYGLYYVALFISYAFYANYQTITA